MKRIATEKMRRIADEPPPLLKTWPRVYAFVVCCLAAVIILFYLFTRHFNKP